MSLLRPEHQQRIEAAYEAFADEDGFAKVATLDEIAAQGFSLSIPLYVKRKATSERSDDTPTLAQAWSLWEESGRAFWIEMDGAVDLLDGLASGQPELAEAAND